MLVMKRGYNMSYMHLFLNNDLSACKSDLRQQYNGCNINENIPPFIRCVGIVEDTCVDHELTL